MSVTYRTIEELKATIRNMDVNGDDTACLSRAVGIMISSTSVEKQETILRGMAEDIVHEMCHDNGTFETYDNILGDCHNHITEGILDSMSADKWRRVPTHDLIQGYLHGGACLKTVKEIISKAPTPTLSRMDEFGVPNTDYVWARRESIEHMLKDIYELVCEAHHKSDEYYFGREENQAVDLAFEDIVNKIKEINGGKLPTTAEAEEDCKP